MLPRLLTGLIGGVALLYVLLLGFYAALLAVAALHALAIWEFMRLEMRLHPVVRALFLLASTAVLTLSAMALSKLLLSPQVAIVALVIVTTVSFAGDLIWYDRTGEIGPHRQLLLALLLITLPFAFIVSVASWPGQFPYLLLLLGAAFGADIGGMIVGMLAGRNKLAPRLSPKKTIEGLNGGMVAAAACWIITAVLWPLDVQVGWFSLAAQPEPLQILLIALAAATVALFGMAGDLTFSLFKRLAGIKDYGMLLPGHGGVLDRFDALLFCAPLIYLIALG